VGSNNETMKSEFFIYLNFGYHLYSFVTKGHKYPGNGEKPRATLFRQMSARDDHTIAKERVKLHIGVIRSCVLFSITMRVLERIIPDEGSLENPKD